MSTATKAVPPPQLAAESPRLPVFLDLQGRRVVLVGGGEVALRKLRDLLTAGAFPVVVAPHVETAVAELAAAGVIDWQARDYEGGDLGGAWFAVAATDDPQVNARVVAEAEAGRIWSVDCSRAEASPAGGAVQVHAEEGVGVEWSDSDIERFPSGIDDRHRKRHIRHLYVER